MTSPARDEASAHKQDHQGVPGGPGTHRQAWAGTTLILIHIGVRPGGERVTPLGCFSQPGGRSVIVRLQRSREWNSTTVLKGDAVTGALKLKQ